MTCYRTLAVIVVCLAATGAAHAQGVTVPIQTCGDLGTDNRPNWCARPTNDGPIQGKSGCRRISDTKFEYIHCSGSAHEITGSSLCCLSSSQCPGATYVGDCLK
ncbi:hypothetical protein CHKEEEPN_4171 [Methylorubrum podarium]|jgi:hypothetical protein|nr:hypothetical protein CHKEEEPN_4171 [Methylorubrum podarium]